MSGNTHYDALFRSAPCYRPRLQPASALAESAVTIPPPAAEASAQSAGLETAVLAGGCFWGIQAVYQHVKGVKNAVSGYAGGAQEDADTTRSARPHRPRRGGAGDVRPAADFLRQDPADLLLGGARPDAAQPPGPGHRPAIPLGDFPADEAQQKIAQAYIAQLDKAKAFKRADRDQDRHDEGARSIRPRIITRTTRPSIPTSPTSLFNDAPKVENLKKTFPDVCRDQPVTVAQAEKNAGN